MQCENEGELQQRGPLFPAGNIKFSAAPASTPEVTPVIISAVIPLGIKWTGGQVFPTYTVILTSFVELTRLPVLLVLSHPPLDCIYSLDLQAFIKLPHSYAGQRYLKVEMCPKLDA